MRLQPQMTPYDRHEKWRQDRLEGLRKELERVGMIEKSEDTEEEKKRQRPMSASRERKVKRLIKELDRTENKR
jgi:leucyl-tRNA synthetase